MLTEKDVDQIEEVVDQRLENKLKKYSSKILNAISDVMKELKDMRLEHTVLSHQVQDRTKRIEKLEEIHPQHITP